MLTATQFQHWCASLHLSQETYQVLLELRASPPARRVGSRGSSVSGAYATRKMGSTIQFESHKVELWAFYTMEHDESVLEYYYQPCQLELHYLSRSRRNQTVSHMPDFLVLRQDGVWLEEWKPEDKLLELTLTQPHRYPRDERGKFHCPPGEEATRRHGLGYRVHSSAELPPHTIHNLIFLEDYFVAPWSGRLCRPSETGSRAQGTPQEGGNDGRSSWPTLWQLPTGRPVRSGRLCRGLFRAACAAQFASGDQSAAYASD